MQASKENLKNEQTSKSTDHLEVIDNFQLLRINADCKGKKQFCLMLVLFFLLSMVVFLLALALPNAIKSHHSSDQSLCYNPIGFNNDGKIICEAFSKQNLIVGIFLTDMSNFNQFALLSILLRVPSDIKQSVEINQYAQFNIYEIYKEEEENILNYRFLNSITNFTALVYFDYSQTIESPSIENQQSLLRSNIATIKLSEQQIKNYLVTIQFSSFIQFQSQTGVLLRGKYINTNFTLFTIVFRSVYLLIGIIAAIIYLKRYCKIQSEDRIIEFKLVAILSIMILFFNDPLYSITVLLLSPVTTFFSALFVCSFMIYLIGFWLFILSKMNNQQFQNGSTLLTIKNWPKFLYLITFFASFMVFLCILSYQINSNLPIIPLQRFYQLKILVPLIITSIYFAIGVIWIIVLFCVAIKKSCKQKLIWRHKINLMLLPFFLGITIMAFLTTIFRYQASIMFYSYSFMNIYVLTMQFLYYPLSYSLEARCKERQLESLKIEKNDEEQLYQQNPSIGYSFKTPKQRF